MVGIVCGYEDCAQTNPPDARICQYCNRPLTSAPAAAIPSGSRILLNLPAALSARYRIESVLPTLGAEAELLLVRANAGGPVRVAKIYRHGIQPRAEVQERIARMDLRHRVEVLEAGVSDGHAFEVMEYCQHGSLREQMKPGPLALPQLELVVREVTAALANVHAVGLLHRDLKPENILVRSLEPLDLVLTDFGISSVHDATQRFTGMARSLPYASPESLSGVLDSKSDYWALGVIVLEASTGKHPFSGLSEAVILHHLTTRNMDLSAVELARLRTLLRGLLLRDPKQRWGATEIARWLAHDPGLAEPTQYEVQPQFNAPYHLGPQRCYTHEQLAVALAAHWEAGTDDIANGQLQAWFREVQHDQNTVRLLLELRFERHEPPDVQLLHLILHLAPGIPPVWRGQALSLASVLTHGQKALQGDSDAAHWLRQLYEYRVLAAYAQAGNPELDALAQRWDAAIEQFNASWDASQELLQKMAPNAGDPARVDDLLFGRHEPRRPALATMHAQMLALAYDTQWVEHARQRISAELVELTLRCPWLAAWGDPLGMDAAKLLVVETLLPDARQAAQTHVRAQEQARVEELQADERIKAELNLLVASVRSTARLGLLQPNACDELHGQLDQYFALLAKVKASGRTDESWDKVKKAIGRPLRVFNQILPLVEHLAQRRAANAGWFSEQTLGFVAFAIFILPILTSVRWLGWILAAIAALAVWRLLPNYLTMRKIRRLAESL